MTSDTKVKDGLAEHKLVLIDNILNFVPIHSNAVRIERIQLILDMEIQN